MFGLPDSLRRLSEEASFHFVQWLTTRTQQRVAVWQVCPHRMSTFIAGPHGPMLIQFVVSSAPQDPHSWRLFTITSSSGIELLRATPTANVHTGPPLASAIDVLFLIVSNTPRSPFFVS